MEFRRKFKLKFAIRETRCLYSSGRRVKRFSSGPMILDLKT